MQEGLGAGALGRGEERLRGEGLPPSSISEAGATHKERMMLSPEDSRGHMEEAHGWWRQIRRPVVGLQGHTQ